jgi:hypothetical protein
MICFALMRGELFASYVVYRLGEHLAHGLLPFFFARLALIPADAELLHFWHFANCNRALVLRLPQMMHLPSARRFARVARIRAALAWAVTRFRGGEQTRAGLRC